MRDTTEKKWLTDKKSLLGETNPNIKLTQPGRRIWPALGTHFILNGADLYIPYCVQGYEVTSNGKKLVADGSNGPFRNGVLHSADSGTTWQVEQISEYQAWDPLVCRTKEFCYYFATKLVRHQGDQLWFTRKPVTDGSWDAPITISKTYVYHSLAVPEGDTVHLCWLDRRHEKRRLNLFHPNRNNFEVAYCQRKDSDATWSKDVILSKGLLYSFAPKMSVEGDKIVVAWAGIQTAKDWHTNFDPNDIYYVTSKDNGKTWAKLLKMTDSAKEGITSGNPQVVLLNGIIHLSYIQGKMKLKEESPGLTKLNQPPWPIYYQQRPFPE